MALLLCIVITSIVMLLGLTPSAKVTDIANQFAAAVGNISRSGFPDCVGDSEESEYESLEAIEALCVGLKISSPVASGIVTIQPCQTGEGLIVPWQASTVWQLLTMGSGGWKSVECQLVW